MEVLRQQNESLKTQVADLKRQLEHSRASSASEPPASAPMGTRSRASLNNIGSWPSFHLVQRGSLPYTQTPLEFELMSKHPNAYQVLEPYADPGTVAQSLVHFAVDTRYESPRTHR